jgi:hypothetical protein
MADGVRVRYVVVQRHAAILAVAREVVLNVVYLVWRQELTKAAWMSFLAPSLFARATFLSALCARWIQRRGTRRVRRVGSQLLLKCGDALFKPPAVID